MKMASEAAKEHSENLIKHAPDRPTKGYLCAKVEAAYDAGAAAVMERLQNEAEKVIANTPPSERAPVASAVRYLLRRMGEPA